MKFGKRRWEAKYADKEADPASAPASESPRPVAESWNVGPEPFPDEPVPVEAELAAAEPVVDGEAVELPLTEVPAEGPVADAEPEVEVEVELEVITVEPEPERPAPYDPGQSTRISEVPAQSTRVTPIPPPRPPGEPLPPPGSSWAPSPPPPPAPPSMPFPVAEEPVLVYTSGPESPAVTPLAEAGEAYASGHAPGTSPSWPEPVLQLANERPEVLVGAAFAGGLLFAMILRRLGN
jgi:hypothetical protein